ncbi:MAG TPA: polysaccharide deacetylase family protein [Aggregatilineales bacterium]|nr:polysaccharide deacetylase family protein [Aggregatilineales bacterium]
MTVLTLALAIVMSLLMPAPGKAIKTTSRPFSIPVLVYHHIAPQVPQFGVQWYVPPEKFDQELAFLHDGGYHTISVDSYVQALQDPGIDLPSRAIVLTFDDGYDDAYTRAYPLLKQYGLTGTFYIITGQVGQPGYLTWDQIREMQANGMEIGAHTISHPFLTQKDIFQAFSEIWVSRVVLAEQLGTPVTTFAYPYNDHNRFVTLLPLLAGFTSACIVDYHSGDVSNDFFAIPRFSILSGESPSTFAAVAESHGLMLTSLAAGR